MIKWRWPIGAAVAAGLAILIFVWWSGFQLWPTGQKMARGPNQIAFFEYDYEGDSGNNVFLLDADTQQVVQLTSNNLIYQMAWSPDGAVLYLSLTEALEDGFTLQVDPATGAITPLADRAAASHSRSRERVSPDGRQIVYLEGGHLHELTVPIMVANRDGSAAVQVGVGGPASWSPDGKRIAFGSFIDGDADIYTANPDGSDTRKLFEHEGAEDLPVWSPDGEHIAFVTLEYGGAGGVEGGAPFIVDADGQNLMPLVSEYGAETYTLEFLPNGKALLRSGPLYMCLIPIDGSDSDCEFVWEGTLSNDGTQASALQIGGTMTDPGGYHICLYPIEGVQFGPQRCDYESSQYQLGYLLWRP